jgi:hypothetical protein
MRCPPPALPPPPPSPPHAAACSCAVLREISEGDQSACHIVKGALPVAPSREHPGAGPWRGRARALVLRAGKDSQKSVPSYVYCVKITITALLKIESCFTFGRHPVRHSCHLHGSAFRV